MILGNERASFADWSAKSCPGRPICPGIQMKLISADCNRREFNAIRMRWEIGCRVYGSLRVRRDERESERMRYLPPGFSFSMEVMQVKMAQSSAVNIDAEFLIRYECTVEFRVKAQAVLFWFFDPSVKQISCCGNSFRIFCNSLIMVRLSVDFECWVRSRRIVGV